MDALREGLGSEMRGVAAGGRERARVLVPGCGLARLNFDVVRAGADCEGNEFSVHMLAFSHFILNSGALMEGRSLEVCPDVLTFTNQRSLATQVSRVVLPDVDLASPQGSLPRDGATAGEMSMSMGDFVDTYGKPEHAGAFDAVLCSFFLDTAADIFEYLDIMARLLPEGGLLCSIGPLQWHYTDQPEMPSLELSLDELRPVIEASGFRIVKEDMSTLPYTHPAASMLSKSYDSWFFVAERTK